MSSTIESPTTPNASGKRSVAAVLPTGFFAASYLLSWFTWLLVLADARAWVSWPAIHAAQTPLLMGGAFGPLLASILLTYRAGGWRAVGQFASQALRYRIPLGPLAIALFLMPLLAAAAAALHALAGGPPFALQVPLASLPSLFVLLFFLGGSFQEEFGWAYAIDRMQRSWSPLAASALLGVIWACWHLPLFFIPVASQHLMPFWSFLLGVVGARIMFVWVYTRAGRSILATLLFHTSFNLSLNLFPILQRDEAVVQYAWIYFCVLTAAAAVPIAWRQWRAGKTADTLAQPAG